MEKDVISNADSSTNHTLKKQETGGDALMKKKLKVLKSALKDEKDLKTKVEKQL